MLEYGVAAIATPIERFLDYLPSIFSTSQHKTRFGQQANCDSQMEVLNSTDYGQGPELDRESMGGNWIDLAREMKAIKQEITKIKAKMDIYATDTT